MAGVRYRLISWMPTNHPPPPAPFFFTYQEFDDVRFDIQSIDPLGHAIATVFFSQKTYFSTVWCWPHALRVPLDRTEAVGENGDSE